MIDDLTGYGPEAELEADLCIVGTGAAGIALARELLGTGLRVIVLESGGMAAEEATDRLKQGEDDDLAGGLVEGRGRAFGGTTTLWAGQCIPLDATDFAPRAWVPYSGWPIARADLDPYYGRAASVLGVAGESHDETLWRRRGITPPALDPDKLGLTYTVWAPQPDLGRAHRGRLRRSRNIRVLLHANVTAVVTNSAASRFDHLVARGLDGSRARIRARACVLACGGIENARLLLASGDPEAGGLANGHDTVGRFFQDHPNGRSARLYAPTPGALQEPYSLLYRGRRRYLPKLTLAPAVQAAEEVLNCGANLQYEFADEGLNAVRRLYRATRRHGEPTDLASDLRLAARGLPAAAATAYRRLARGRSSAARPATIWLQTHSEQAPSRDSRVLLSRQRDALGSNLARVQWRLTTVERRTAEVMARTVADELGRLGLAEVELSDWLGQPDGRWTEALGDSYHHAGTTRMSREPADGVVDSDCQVHGISGLYVTGSSVFPTSGFANPTLTIVALAVRLADHLRTSVG